MREREPRGPGAEILLGVALAVWALFPLALLLAHASSLHASFTGANGLIGADGVLGADQLQYLAWIRDAAGHAGAASDLFTFAPSSHVYVQPVFSLSALLYRLGLSLTLAYLVWKPVAIACLFIAACAWCRRFVPNGAGARAAATALALFLYTPLDALFSWAHLGRGGFGFSLYLLGNELLAADKLWGYVPSALGLALVPVSLLALDRAVGRGAPRPALAPLLGSTAAALLASWLHPWQGITLILIFAGLAAVNRLRPALTLTLALPAIGAALPLGYYYLLSHHDPAWHLAGQYEVIPRLPTLVLLAGLGPLALAAAPGVRRPRGVLLEQALLLWVVACLVTYFANDSFAPHALQGISLPLAVLIVRGWRRLHDGRGLGRRAGTAVGVVGVALLTVPGLAYDARKFVRTADSRLVQYYLPDADARALAYVAHAAPTGGVLAPTPFAAIVPGRTGRHVWTGHGYWSADYPAQAREVDRLFGGRMPAAQARRFVASTGATVLVADCGHRASLTRSLRPLLVSVRSFGCARVYVLRRAAPGDRSASR